jgi:uncharacterized protein YneR
MKKNNSFSIEIDEIQLDEIEDVYNSNIEVCVRLEDGFPLVIVVGTPKNFQYLMEKDKVNFYGPGLCSKINQGNYPRSNQGLH